MSANPDLRTVRFFAPANMAGKWHAKRIVTGEADCGATVLLGDESLVATKDDIAMRNVHPIACRRCVRLNGPGYSSLRIVK